MWRLCESRGQHSANQPAHRGINALLVTRCAFPSTCIPWQRQLRDAGCSVLLRVEGVASTAVPRASRVSKGVLVTVFLCNGLLVFKQPLCPELLHRSEENIALVWGALELWVRGVPDDGNDHSSNKLSVLKALTCLEGQSARVSHHQPHPGAFKHREGRVCCPTTARPHS